MQTPDNAKTQQNQPGLRTRTRYMDGETMPPVGAVRRLMGRMNDVKKCFSVCLVTIALLATGVLAYHRYFVESSYHTRLPLELAANGTTALSRALFGMGRFCDMKYYHRRLALALEKECFTREEWYRLGKFHKSFEGDQLNHTPGMAGVLSYDPTFAVASARIAEYNIHHLQGDAVSCWTNYHDWKDRVDACYKDETLSGGQIRDREDVHSILTRAACQFHLACALKKEHCFDPIARNASFAPLRSMFYEAYHGMKTPEALCPGVLTEKEDVTAYRNAIGSGDVTRRLPL